LYSPSVNTISWRSGALNQVTEHLYKSTFQDMLKALVHIHSLDIVI